MSPEQLGDAAGLHRTSIGHSERGEVDPSLLNILKVSAALGLYAGEEVADLTDTIGDPCGKRVKALAAQASALRTRRQEVADQIDDVDLACATPEQLAALREQIKQALAEGSPATVKTLLQALIHEIRVDSRQAIHPVFRVPLARDHQSDDAVRAPSGLVGAEGHDTIQMPHISLDACSPDARIPQQAQTSCSRQRESVEVAQVASR